MLRFFAVALLLTAFSTTASGGILGPLVGQGPVLLEDDDWESQITDGGTLGRLSEGDILFSVIQIQGASGVYNSFNTSYSSSTATITGVSAIKVKAGGLTTVSGPNPGEITEASYDFEGLSSSEWANLLGVGVGLSGVTSGTVAVLFDDPASAPNTHINITNLLTGLTTASNGVKLAEFFIGSTGSWIAKSTDSGLGADATDPIKINSLVFRAALETTDTRFGLHNTLSDPGVVSDTDTLAFFASAGLVDLQLTGQLASGPRGGFQLRTDSDLYVNIVPEPTSMAIFTLLGGLSIGRRRK